MYASGKCVALSRNYSFRGNAISVIYFMCVLVCARVQVGERERGRLLARVSFYLSSTQRVCALLTAAALLASPRFLTFYHKRQDFQEKKILKIKCVF